MLAATRRGAHKRNSFRIVTGLLPWIWPSGDVRLRERTALAVCALVGAKVCEVSVPLMYARIVDALAASTTVSVPYMAAGRLLLALVLLRIGSSTLQNLRDISFTKVRAHAMRGLSVRLLSSLHRATLEEQASVSVTTLMRVLQRGGGSVATLLESVTFNIIPVLIEIVLVTIIVSVQIDWIFAAITLSSVAVYIGITAIATERRMVFREYMNKADEEASAVAYDSLINSKLVKEYCREQHEVSRYDRVMEIYERRYTQYDITLKVLTVVQSAIVSVGLGVTLASAAWMVIHNRITVGDFVLLNMFVLQIFLPLEYLGQVYREFKQAIVDVSQMLAIIGEKALESDRRPELRPGPGRVTFDSVSFGYQGRETILSDVSFEAPSGRITAIVGESGAGKSTIAHLMVGHIAPQRGRILVDGEETSQVRLESLRSELSIISQEPMLFQETIEYNIQYGKADAQGEDIKRVSRLAQISHLLVGGQSKIPTRLGERGLTLSGGERQRICIARAALRASRILILDESTSALDGATERTVQASLARIRSGQTTIIITHRLSTLKKVDHIVVLDRGRVAECGSFSDLIENNGAFRKMWDLQSGYSCEPSTSADNHKGPVY